MEGFIIACVGFAVGIIIPVTWQIGIGIVAIISMFFVNSKNHGLDGIGTFIYVGMWVLFGVGMVLGDGFLYIKHNYIENDTKITQSLPALICKNGIDNFVITEYTYENKNIINIKTGQIFLKENCNLK